ncbi:MAG: FeoA family protein [Candidatus Bipolaricaulota bacterium]
MMMKTKEVMITISLAQLRNGAVARVVGFTGGRGFKRRLATRGIKIGAEVRIVTRQPAGPLVIEVARRKMTLGRGMARKIQVEVSL